MMYWCVCDCVWDELDDICYLVIIRSRDTCIAVMAIVLGFCVECILRNDVSL